MPDHMHLLITPAPHVSIEKAMQFIKGGFSFRLKSKFDVWQSRYTKRRIEDSHDYANHMRYIHENPVRARLCEQATDFAYSSASGRTSIEPAPAHLKNQG